MSFRGKPHNLHMNLFKASSDEIQHGYNMALDSQQLPSMSYVVALYRVKTRLRSASTDLALRADLPLLGHLEIDRRRTWARLIPLNKLYFVAFLKRGMCGRGGLVRGASGIVETVASARTPWYWTTLLYTAARPVPCVDKHSRY